MGSTGVSLPRSRAIATPRALAWGPLIEAPVIGAAGKGDKEAAWGKHRTRAPAHGDKARLAAGKDSGILRAVATTAANEPDVAIAPSVIPDAPGEVYADKADAARAFEKAIEAAGGTSNLGAKAIAGSRPKRSRRLIVRGARSARGVRKSSAPGSAAIIFVPCDGSGSPRAKSISPPSLTTSSASGGGKPPERRAAAPAKPLPQSSSARRHIGDFRARRR